MSVVTMPRFTGSHDQVNSPGTRRQEASLEQRTAWMGMRHISIKLWA